MVISRFSKIWDIRRFSKIVATHTSNLRATDIALELSAPAFSKVIFD